MQDTSTLKSTLSKSPHLQRDFNRAYCKKSFYYFVRFFWDTIIAEEFIPNWHIKYICEEMQAAGERTFLKSRGVDKFGKPLPKNRLPKEFDYCIINVPPGSSKSTVCSEMYPLWCWVNDATQRFICGSYASTPAEDIAEKCYNIYQSEKFRYLFPDLHPRRPAGGKTNFKNGLKGERYTTSTGSGITGIHAHQIIIDDPMNPAIAASKTEREKANKWVSETLGSRKVSHDVTITWVIMQRLHEMDTTGYLLKKEGLRIKHICIPAELSADVKPVALRDYYTDSLFDPVRRSHASLAFQKIELGTYGYAGQMQQRPTPEAGGIIKKHWFTTIARPYTNEAGRTIHFQVDTAYTEDETNDPTAVMAYYVEHGNVFIVNVQSVYKEFPDLIKWLPLFVANNGYGPSSRIYIEPKASGKSVVQQLKAGTNLNIVEDVAPEHDKLTRLHTCSPKIEAGRVILHEGGWNDNFVTQVCGFPTQEHDDEVDDLTAVIRRELLVASGINPGKLAAHFR